jgi:hypothetical protein
MPRKVFTAGEVLAASDVNDFLMDQTVMTFAGTAARGSAIPTPAEGMYAHLNDTDTLTYYDGSDWVNRIGASAGVLQVVQAVKTDTSTRSTTTFDDIAGLSVSITPSSTSSKILVIAQVVAAASSSSSVFLKLVRGATDIYVGDAAGSRARVSIAEFASADNRIGSQTISFLDSPNTTSSTTYKIQFASSAAAAIYVNRTVIDTDASNFTRSASSITAMEVAG